MHAWRNGMKSKVSYCKKTLVCLLFICMVLISCQSNHENSNSKIQKPTQEQKVARPSTLATSGTGDTNSESKSIIDRESVDKSNMDLSSMSAEEITSLLTLEEMAAQMVQPAIYNMKESLMKTNDYGSILSISGYYDSNQWMTTIRGFQKAALDSAANIPFIYGQDDVHGVNYCKGAVIFPHNIGIGAANDEDLTYKMGQAVADEAKLCGMLWNFSPCVAVATDPRWGRTYESYSSEVPLVRKLSGAYTKGMIDSGLVACGKHFFADGNVEFGSGEGENLIDRGNAELSDAEIKDLLSVYQNLIDQGVQTIMISHSSLNGVKMHENAEYIGKLKNEMGFKGMIVSDWESIHNIPGDSLYEQVVKSINAGIDMLMEPNAFEECQEYIVQGVKDGKISEDRVVDAVNRIIKVKLDAGIFKDPMMENMNTVQKETGSKDYRELAEKLVEESLVLLKNDKKVLPLKKNTRIYLIGPAVDNIQAQCGGWTKKWEGDTGIEGCTSILQGFKDIAGQYGFTIVPDANDADVTILCVGEKSYAEWNGDTKDLLLTGSLGLEGNEDAIDEAKELRDQKNIPTVACIVAGRNVLISDYLNDWDAAVMCYLPGSEAQGVAHVLSGDSSFKGKLPMPWYKNVNQIKTKDSLFKVGYGLSY